MGEQAKERPRHGVDPPMTEPQRQRMRREVERIKAGAVPPSLERIPLGFEHTWEMTLSPEVVRLYYEPVEDYNPWYEEGGESPFGFPVVPPLFLSHEARKITMPLGPMPGRIHTLHESEVLAPIPVGTRVRLHGRVTNKGMKKGRPWVEETLEVRDAHTGQLYFRDRRETLLTLRREE